MAERAGFEPARPVAQPTRSPGAPIRPLWHLSKYWKTLRCQGKASPIKYAGIGNLVSTGRMAGCRWVGQKDKKGEIKDGWMEWRRGRDSNPRYAQTYTAFRERRLRPLGHLSGPEELDAHLPLYIRGEHFRNNWHCGSPALPGELWRRFC